MKNYKTVAVPETTKQVLEKTTCDLCGEEIRKDSYKVDEVSIKHQTGEAFPEGGDMEETTVDMCGKCFDEKLVPWLKSQGAQLSTREWEYEN